ncbi:COR domain-containing protein [Haloferula sp. BvORR071]|uniref:COR domain-containing protein n=1 Tax=Haloferula sp. BvORR071 TaxID=1396141 RepID=UPI002240E9BC|nr:COR domain-containing protein [Haloferula sp. BvORR071]
MTRLHEAKLVLVGEGEVGKSWLLGALRDDPVEDRGSTHGIEIKKVPVIDPQSGQVITLNGWDFGGQPVYRPTHQMFFSAPALYLVVWKPREGPQQSRVKEWIKLVKHRAPEARIFLVATHGGPKARQPDLDRQEILDLFGEDTIAGFFHVDSQPRTVEGKAADPRIAELKEALAREAAALPGMGREFPAKWQELRQQLKAGESAYLPKGRVFDLCSTQGISSENAELLVRICHAIGDLIHYEHDPLLQDIVVVKPTWLATAISYVLDDQRIRETSRGLVSDAELAALWDDPGREHRYPPDLHPIFRALMERFDLSYPVAGHAETCLISQLVPDFRPQAQVDAAWPDDPAEGDEEQTQICRITDMDRGETARAEGLFYQLIVRLHKYSLGRLDFCKSVHWQRGLLLEDSIGSRAYLEHAGNDVQIRVRSPYPAAFLGVLTYEVKWLVENFWKGLRCAITVPCLTIKEDGTIYRGFFEVASLLKSKKADRHEMDCRVCDEWYSIDDLLSNSVEARPDPLQGVAADAAGFKRLEGIIRSGFGGLGDKVDGLTTEVREAAARAEASYRGLMSAVLDEARDGPRLFSIEPLEPGFWNKPKWMAARFRVTLWCEYNRLPLHHFPGHKDRGVYEIEINREWLVAAAPWLKRIAVTLGLVLPVAGAVTKVVLDATVYDSIENQLDLGKETADALAKTGEMAADWLAEEDGGIRELRGGDGSIGPRGEVRAEGALLRQLHHWLKENDKASQFGGLVRVPNKRQEFMWVHPDFAGMV